MVWVFQWLRSCFFTLIFLEKRWNSGTHFDVQKYSHAKKVTWICHGISPWMRDCIIDCSRQNSVARMQFIQFFCNLLTLTYFDLFHKITTKTCYKSRRAADLAKHHDDPSHGLRTPGEEIVFTAQPKIKSQSQICRYGGSIFCLPHQPKISGFFYLCVHWVSIVRAWRE